MSVAELKLNLIEKITQIEDPVLINKLSELVNIVKPRPKIEQIFEEASAQYGNTLKRLAE